MQLDYRKFVAQVDHVFAESLASFGFAPDGKDHQDHWHASRWYRKGGRYIKISASCHLRDGPPECRLILGEGATDWPEGDWNSVALWRLRGAGGNYPLPSVAEIPDVLLRIHADLLSHGADFLNSDLTRFFQQRVAQNSVRNPYKIHSPQPDGSYRTTDDLESRELKERFSRPHPP